MDERIFCDVLLRQHTDCPLTCKLYQIWHTKGRYSPAYKEDGDGRNFKLSINTIHLYIH